MTLNEQSPATLLTFGNFINVMLIVFIVVGIIMCACIGVNYSLYYLGPAFIGLAFFALVGKIFFTNCFMDDHPLEGKPEFVKQTAEMAEKIIGGTKDPYKSPRNDFGYMNPMMVTSTTTTTMVTDTYQMDTMRVMSDPGAAATSAAAGPKMYDESIDTRLRYASSALYLNCRRYKEKRKRTGGYEAAAASKVEDEVRVEIKNIATER